MTTYNFAQNIFPHLADWQNQGLKTALATLVSIDGSSPRPRGAQIGVAEDGRHIGIISSGCAEEAIIAAALDVLNTGRNRLTRYGKDSPYLDVVLPCGSGLDILFTSSGLNQVTQQVSARHAARQTAYITPQQDGTLAVHSDAEADSLAYPPDYYLHVFGAGPQLTSFATLAHHMGYRLCAHSTDDKAIALLAAQAIDVAPMNHQTRFQASQFDAHSAVITLFHEHALELPILQAALNSEAHFIGAMGSRKTHLQRQADLQAADTRRPFSDITGPIGLDIGASDPMEIGLAILAQIVQKRRQK